MVPQHYSEIWLQIVIMKCGSTHVLNSMKCLSSCIHKTFQVGIAASQIVSFICRTCFFTIESAGCKSRFMAQINNSFGSGGMSLAFNEMQFAAFVQFLKMHNSVNIRTAATIVGQQSCGQVWVMGETQIDGEGKIMAPNTSPYIWLNKGTLGEVGSVATNELLPTIHTPLSIDVLSRFLNVLEVVMKHNFFSAVLVVAGGVLSLHYSTIVKEHVGCPIVVAFGTSETGKTTALTAALSLTGMYILP